MTLANSELPHEALARPRAAGAPARLRRLAFAGLFVLAVAALVLPVAWNGFVLIYPDSIDYLGLSFIWQMPEFRTACYGIFAGIGRLAGDPVAIVIAQSSIVVAVIALSVRAQIGPKRFLSTFVLVMGAALLGGISLFASQIMADVFAGAVVLGLVSLMVFADGLTTGRRILLALLSAVAVAVHTSHVGLGLGLLALGVLVKLVGLIRPSVPKVRLRAAAFSVVLGVVLAMGSNFYVIGRATLTQTVTVQNLALFIEGGSAKAYLDAKCPAPGSHKPAPYRLCAYKDQLPSTANEFLWAKWASPLYKLGGWNAMREEADAIVRGTLKTMPLAVLRQSVVLTAEQFFMLDPGDGLDPRWEYYPTTIAEWYPHTLVPFLHSRQQRGIDFKPLVWPIRAVMGLSLAAILILTLAAIRLAPRQALFGGAILLAVLGNAFICGALSNPNHRYQGRLVWLAASAAVLMVSARVSSGRARPTR